MVGLQGVSDNFRGKTVTLVAGCLLFHAAQSAKPQLNCQYWCKLSWKTLLPVFYPWSENQNFFEGAE
jgi:hypothetical protein